jgi:hypothetical protein
MLGHDAAFAASGKLAFEIVLHRHRVAGEWHHPGAMVAMPVIQWGGLQGL